MIAYLKEFEERYPGLEDITINASMGTPRAVILEQLERFAREVMPAFSPRPVVADAVNTNPELAKAADAA